MQPRPWGEFPVWGSGPSPTLGATPDATGGTGATLCDTSCYILGYLRPDNMCLKKGATAGGSLGGSKGGSINKGGSGGSL